MAGSRRLMPWLAICVVTSTACSTGAPLTPSSSAPISLSTTAPATTSTTPDQAPEPPPTTTTTTTSGIAATTFAVIGDYGNAGSKERAASGMIHEWSPDFVITAGDNVYGAIGYDAAVGEFYADFIGSYSGGHGPGSDLNRFFPALGNHDYSDASLEDYEAYFTLPGTGYVSSSGNERYYDVVLGPVHWFFVNSNGLEPDGIDAASAQASWLRAGLASSLEPWQVVVFHHAPYGSAHHGGETELRWPFAEWGADLVLNGHNHDYERFAVDGITYATVGLGMTNEPLNGNPLDPHSVFFFGDADTGALFLTACDTALSAEYVTVGSGPIDRFSIGSGSCPG